MRSTVYFTNPRITGTTEVQILKQSRAHMLVSLFYDIISTLSLSLSGYQRELTYRHSDGSYSAFGESDDEGSLWLTSFVVRSFARAQPFIYVDPADLSASIAWIKAQQLENGCFRPVPRSSSSTKITNRSF